MRGSWLFRFLLIHTAAAAVTGPAPAPPIPSRRQENFAATKAMMETYSLDKLIPSIAKDDVKVDASSTCGALYKEKCSDITPGMGRAASCLRDYISATTGKVNTKTCRVEVNRFFVAVRKEITMYNTALNTACKNEIAGICSTADTGMNGPIKVPSKHSSRFTCLKRKKKELSEECAAAVFQEMVEEAKDVNLDSDIMSSCKDDIDFYCRDKPSKEIVECLSWSAKNAKKKKKQKPLTAACKKVIFDTLEEQTEDMRLDPELVSSCAQELNNFCIDVGFGDGDKKACLFEHRTQTGFTVDCRGAIEKTIGFEAKDARLSPKLPLFCRSDMKRLCAVDDAKTNAVLDAPDSSSIECMIKNLKRIQNTKCVKEVQRVAGVRSEVWDASSKVEGACENDVDKFCGSLAIGASVQDCLRENLNELSEKCRVEEFKELKTEAQTMDLKPALKRACAKPIKEKCGDCGGLASTEIASCAIKCLKDLVDTGVTDTDPGGSLTKSALPQSCMKRLRDYDKIVSSDFRLVPGLPEHCADDIRKFCALEVAAKGENGEGKVGSVLECLAENRAKLQPTCKDDVKPIMKVKAEAPEMDAYSASACRRDIAIFCPTASKGEDLHNCLRLHQSLLDVECQHVEFQDEKASTSDLAFNPSLKNMCRGPIRTLCADSNTPEDVMRCLEDLVVDSSSQGTSIGSSEENKKASVPPRCKNEIEQLIKLKNKDYRLNPILKDACDSDIERLCSFERMNADASEDLSGGVVISCLINNRDDIGDLSCTEAVHRKMVQRVHEATNDPLLIDACAQEIEMLCYDVPSGEGNLHRCLFIDHLDYLSDTCKSLEVKYQEMKRSDVSLNSLMMKHCKPVLRKYCRGKSNAEKMQCLENHIDSPETTAPCRSRVLDEPILRSKSILLNPNLKAGCQEDLNELIRTRRCKAPFSQFIQAVKSKQSNEASQNNFPSLITPGGDGPGENQGTRALRGKANAQALLRKVDEKRKENHKGKFLEPLAFKEMLNSVKSISMELSGRDVQCLLDNENADSSMKSVNKKSHSKGNVWRGVSPTCKQALVSVKRARAKDLRANPAGGTSPCATDIQKFCPGMEDRFGTGEVNRCLQSHLGVNILRKKDNLSKECATIQGKLVVEEAAEFMSNPMLEYRCVNEKSEFCNNIKDGGGRIQTCLSLKAKRDPNAISLSCKAELDHVFIKSDVAKQLLELHINVPGFVVESKSYWLSILSWLTTENMLWLLVSTLKIICMCIIFCSSYTVALMCYHKDCFNIRTLCRKLRTRSVVAKGR